MAVPGEQNPIFYAEEATVGNVTVHFGEITSLTRNKIKQRISIVLLACSLPLQTALCSPSFYRQVLGPSVAVVPMHEEAGKQLLKDFRKGQKILPE